ncbi:MAG: hypothetical protein JWL81_1892 [Verrucomicrobiales bacterium]|nr:hypothetical protein [Verrucomicrobiales bacterium]
MARAAAVPPPPMVPFWQLSAFRWGVVAMAAVMLLTGMMWLEKMNRHYQLERRLEEDPRLGPMAAELKKQILKAQQSGVLKDATQAARGQIPQALWLGPVTEVLETVSQEGTTLVLSSPVLLAGQMGPHDRSDQVKIGRRKYVYSGPRPKVGEMWLVSVWRDTTGNAIHSAAKYTRDR